MDHSTLVRILSKDGEEIRASLTAIDCELLHMSLLALTEVGELGDAIKKAVIYRKPLDLPNIKEELGDLEFALERLRQLLGISREEVLQQNISKLSKRYGEKYSDQAAQERKDKQ